MALSGTINLRYTAAQVVEFALKKAGIVGQGFSVSADEQNDAIDTLNQMIKTWSTEGPNLWAPADQLIILNPGQATYTLSPRPRLVYNARWCSSVITNRALYCRDWTQSAWTKSNMTTALSQTGVDGVASSATLLTASSSNATALQSVTRAEDDWVFALKIRRVTGTGAVSLTLDGGSTYTAITSDLSADYWVATGIEQTAVTNPSFGIKIATSGDAVAVDYAIASVDGISTTTFPSILTTTANASSGVEALPLSEWDRQDWDRFIYKTNPATGPTSYVISKGRTDTTITFWPVPSFTGNYAVNVGYERALEIVTAASQDIDLPEEAMEAVIMCLAARLIEDYQLPEDANTIRIRQRAATLYDQFMGFDHWGDVKMVVR